MVRTEYVFSSEGTSYNPLTISACIFASSAEECQNPPTVYQQSNFWSQNMSACWPWAPCNNFWNLILNNENAYTTANSGPPDASLPRSLPGQGIFGFNTIYDNFPGNSDPGDNMWRAHLVLNMSSQFPNPSTDRLPYMAFGAWTGRSTPGLIGVLNPSSGSKLTTIQFGARLWQWIPTTHWPSPEYQDQGLVLGGYVVAFSDWGTYPKAIQINLFHWGWEDMSGWGKLDWNWPINESTYYPGARFLVVNAEDLQGLCGMNVPQLTYPSADVNYSIDLNALFHCADQYGMFNEPLYEPLPATANIPITSVSWATEGSGRDGAVWIDVHDMRMVSANQAAFAATSQPNSAATGYSPATARIKQRWDALCAAAPGCPERAAAVERHDPEVYDLPGPAAERLKGLHDLLGWNFDLQKNAASDGK